MPMNLPLLLLLWVGFVSGMIHPSEFDTQINDLILHVIKKHFGMFRCVTYILDKGVELSFGQEMPALVIRSPSEKELLIQSYEQGCGGYIVRVRDKSGVIRHLINAKNSATASRYSNQRYLFLPTDARENAGEILQEPEMFFMPNLALVVPVNDSFLITTHTVFDHHKHDLLGIFREDIDFWTPGTGFSFENDLYPDKLVSLNGKKLVFAVLNYSPFSLVETEGNKTVFDGFETRIAAEFVSLLNGTWEGLDHPDLWGTTFPNGSGTGVVGSILDGRADLGFSAFYQWFCEECDCTYPFYQSAVTCLVPRPQPLSGWLTIILPFTTDTWTALIVTYFLTSTTFLAIQLSLQHKDGIKIPRKIPKAISDSFFTNFRLQLQQTPDVRKMKGPLAVYVKISMYYYFFVATFWQGGISSILTLPSFEEPINTVADLLERWPKVKWGANSDAWTNSIKASTDPNLVQIVKKFTTHDDDTLRKKTKTRDFGFFMEKLPHGHYGFSGYIDEESMKYLRLMESDIYTAFGVFITPRGSPYAEKFDKVILRLYDSGIVHKIEVQVSLERINNRLQNMIRFSNMKDSRTATLALKHILGAVALFLAGMSMAAVVLLLEICHHRQKLGILKK